MKRNQNEPFQSYGTYGGAFPLMIPAWKGLQYIFAVQSELTHLPSTVPKADHMYTGLRCKHKLLNRHPVDILAVDAGDQPIIKVPNKPEHWEMLVKSVKEECRPKIIVEAWPSRSAAWEFGPVGKANRIRWSALGYSTRMERVDPQDINGSIIQPRLMLVRIKGNSEWNWMPISPLKQKRPMSNLLTPPGLIKRRPNLYKEDVKGHVSNSQQDPMPAVPGRWIKTDRGIRRLMNEEICRGLGAPKEWNLTPEVMTAANISKSTSVYHWEYIGQSLSLNFPTTPVDKHSISNGSNPLARHEAGHQDAALTSTITWRPPDLSKDGEWYKARVARLKASALRYPNFHQVVKEGLEDLDRHRTNYNEDGPNPTTLQLLWWEFPIEHQEDVRQGASMNFLKEPTPGLTQNSDMTDEQLVAAGEFVDELISLGVLQMPPKDRETLLNAPLFVLPKAGQPGQWRCIADMLRGGQNMCIGVDPTILPRANDILQSLYRGGYSAVVDMSKYFYQFRTRATERKWLGTIHPVTGTMYEYFGLPTGSGNSPAITCRIGQGFLRMLRRRYRVFQGKSKPNCYWTSFTDLGYNPDLGYGIAMQNEEGLVAKVWGFVDDFLIHGPTKAITDKALHAFLDAACDVGFLCHPQKCTAPSQSVKYIGFIFDTVNIPTLRIPTDKRERALNITRHLRSSPPSQRFSRLGLAVAAGILQSLVDATPSFLGNTYLRQFHSLVHPPGLGTGVTTYLSYTTIPEPVRRELGWWEQYLQQPKGRVAYSQQATTLIPTWGDGSGTGTGGTLSLPNQPLQMWQGQWTPTIYKFSSNTKELATLLLTMQHLRNSASSDLKGSTIFYFTDNSTTYYVAQASSSRAPHLHQLIEQIRHIELQLECHLQVVHVPGTVMIDQGTDNLSRGIWCSPFHKKINQQALTASIFAPLQPDLSLIHYLVKQYHLRRDWQICDWQNPWDTFHLFDQFTIWFPPPELARPLLLHLLNTWSEKPWTTEAMIMVPCVMAAFWQGLSRHIKELCAINPSTHPLYRSPALPIPIIVLHLDRHRRMLPTRNRLDRLPFPRWGKPHQQEAEAMRGMPSSN